MREIKRKRKEEKGEKKKRGKGERHVKALDQRA
jgi:hypothetical protein